MKNYKCTGYYWAVAAGLLCLSGTAAAEQAHWQPYGYVKLDLARDSAGSSPGNFPLYVLPHTTGSGQARLSLTARQTRLGLKLKRGLTRGRIEMDFYGAGAENKNAVQLRYAYVDIPLGPVELSAGQAADLILPLTPATLNYGVLYGIGNLGFRRPQLNAHYRSGPYHFSLGLGRNLSDDLDGDGITDGDASGLPALQCRLGMHSATTDDKNGITMGVSGHYGRCSCPDNDTHYANWSLGFDALLELGPRLGLAGEAFWGENLRQFGGAIYQADRLDGLHSHGGWLDLRFKAAQRWRLAAGAGFERVNTGDLDGSTNARSRNSALFFNGRYRAATDVDLGLEVSRHQTNYHNRDAAMAAAPASWRLHWTVRADF
jgi:hypothetical protein